MNRPVSRLALLPLLLVTLLLAACGGGVDVPKTADLAVLRVANGVAENKPVVIWDALPESYQKDVHELVHTLVNKVDATLYNEVTSTAQQLTKVLKSKKQFILAHPMIAQQLPNKAEVEKQWDQLVGIIDAVVNSELGKHETAKTVNLGAFLDSTGSKIMGDLTNAAKLAGPGENPGEANEFVEIYEKLKKTKATMVKEDGDKAIVRIEMPGVETETKDVEFFRVEGKWLPKDLVDNWKNMMDEARKELADMDTSDMKQAKEMAIPMLGMVKGVLTTLENAKTQEDFNAAVNGLMQMMSGGGGDNGF